MLDELVQGSARPRRVGNDGVCAAKGVERKRVYALVKITGVDTHKSERFQMMDKIPATTAGLGKSVNSLSLEGTESMGRTAASGVA